MDKFAQFCAHIHYPNLNKIDSTNAFPPSLPGAMLALAGGKLRAFD